MSKRLSKISRDINIGISDIVEFLNSNGYDCEEDPMYEIQEDVVDFLRNNIELAPTSEKSFSTNNGKSKKDGEITGETSEIPLELKIIDEASNHTRLTEKIIGFTDYDWRYTVTKYTGTCSQPVNFTLFDEVLCDILSNQQMSAIEIGNILGLDIETDPAERDILISSINELKKDQMLEGDESVYWLSDVGAEYARNGVKFSTFSRNFELYIDNVAGIKEDAKKIFSKLHSEKQSTNSETSFPQDFEEVKILAEKQAPEIHFPPKNYLLQSCEQTAIEEYIAKLWVVLIENFRDKTNRVLVYDDVSGKIIEPLSEAISKMEDQKELILNKILSESETSDFAVEITSDEKDKTQIEQEKELIELQDKIDVAVEKRDMGAISSIRDEVKQIKRHFNSLEFEVELKHLFDETRGELWIISPWIKNATLKRIPFFEGYLKKGGKIFVAYSEPEDGVSPMAYQEPYNRLMELDVKYQNFYIHQLPAFHYKRVWLINDGTGTLYYTGSYNILSFFVRQGSKNIRQEEMTKIDWNDEVNTVYQDILAQFGVKYFNKASSDFNELCQNPPSIIDKVYIQKVKNFNCRKLHTFVGRGIKQIDEFYQQIEDAKEENLKFFKDKYSEQELDAIYMDISKIGANVVPVDKKRSIQSRLNILLNDFPEINKNEKLTEIKELIRNIKTPKLGKNLNWKNKRRW